MIRAHFLAGTALAAIPRLAFDTEGESSGGDSTPPADGQGGESKELSTEEALEQEFGYDLPDGEDEDEDGLDSEDGSEYEGDDEESEESEEAEEGEESEESGEESTGEEAEGEPSAREKELAERAEAAEAEMARVREEAEKAGVVIGAADDGLAIPEEPDPSKYQFGENDLDYIKDRAAYDAKIEILQVQARARFNVEAAALEAKWTKNLAASIERLPDFDEVVVKGAAEKKWPCPPVVALAIKDSDYGPDIAYELAKNPSEAIRISGLTPLEQAREFGRLEERHHQKAEAAKRKTQEEAERQQRETQRRRISKAPPPPKRQIRGSGGQGKRNLAELAASDDFAAFDKAVDALNKRA